MAASEPRPPPAPGETLTKERPEIVEDGPPVLPPFPGGVTKDQPGPTEQWWRQRRPGQHAVPYDILTVRKSLQLFDAMLNDETVAYGHKLKITSRLSSGWSLQAPTDEDGDPLPGSEQPLVIVQEALERIDFDAFLEMMLDGTRQGFKLCEIITKDGRLDGRKAWAIERLAVRNSRFFAFDPLPDGRLKDDGILEYIDPSPDGGGVQNYWPESSVARHSPEKFVRWSYQPLDSNAYSMYGRSDFLAAYRTYFLGDNQLKGLGETLEGYRHPLPVMITRPGLSDGQRELALNALITALKRNALVVPGEYLPEGTDPQKYLFFHEVTGKADQILKALGYLDTARMRALLVGQLVAETGGDGRGSYALGKQHVSIFLRIMSHIGKTLGSAVCEGLFKRIVSWNLGEEAAELAPALVWHAAGDAETLERAQIVQALLDGGAIDPREKWIRDYVGQFPKMDAELEAMRDEENNKRLEAETRPPPAAGAGGPPKGKAEGLAAAGDPPPAEPTVEPTPRGPEREERHLDDTGIAAFADAAIEDLDDDLDREWGRVFNGLKAWFRVASDGRDRGEAPVDTRRVEEAAVGAGMTSLVLGWLDGAIDLRMRMQDDGLSMPLAAEGLAAKERQAKPPAVMTLEDFARKEGIRIDRALGAATRGVEVPTAKIRALAEEQRRKITDEIRAEGARLRREAKAAVERARSRKGRAERMADLRDLERRWRKISRGLQPSANPHSALAEMVTNRAFNEARFALYETLPDEIAIGYMWSAQLMATTCPFCRAWDRYRAPKDSPIWRRLRPPVHYHCHCSIAVVLVTDMSRRALAEAAKRKPRISLPAGKRVSDDLMRLIRSVR